MTSPQDPPAADDADADATSAPDRPRWWLGLVLFVAGVVVGVLAVGLLNTTTPDFGGTAGSGATPEEPAPAPTGGVPVVARAEVNAACLRVINEAQDVYNVLQGVDEAVVDVDLQQLDDMVRRLQPIQPRLARDLGDCRVDSEAVLPTPSAAPSAPPSSGGTPLPSPTG
ncbi:hypothetical protein DT076_15445 [Desertihabitans brevis]|uniref:Uncharacterized protein n=1 Tax=Desertihabitans brevis TaxID=2268447 RepID=A0A367YS18_9ACTN|nr:hypothetical protein [Desertihabitans brevis]RCK68618.1 hypothetical protein DT076_15445 [Desertihabitans brevis]